ncbi:OLC1v1003722C1 [Oldenlandia corymbosa var. corymbosa]|uniref:OLC1v1003722C1 n=1 Tax=Oldenlandia corymbosa var. corymbosa TaxID=529605 RepID=A0AAV1DCJ2_OLDCO|nr:OLC1v1003722C1 [Oldenlandia corymbosa var. corymbosa]
MTSLHQPWLLPFLHFLIICFSSISVSHSSSFLNTKQPNKLPRLGIINRYDTSFTNSKGRSFSLSASSSSSSSSSDEDFKPYFYDQTLDHFNYNPESYTRFKQYFVINSKYWGGANSSAPILAYLGAEAALDGDIGAIGFLTDNAPRFKALQVYIEHRFYGKSNPLGSMNKSVTNEDIRGYFNSAQALADYAEILLHVREKLSAHNSPIIVAGGSYGGMLASWFRLKYPHVALGAFASSAPVLYFDDITPQNGYYSKVTEDFKEASENCYQTVRDSWSTIDEVASKPKGLTILSEKFRSCKHLNSSSDLKDYLDTMYASVAQYNAPPAYPVTQFCKGVDEAAANGSDVLDRIFAGIVALSGHGRCYTYDLDPYPSETLLGWSWQTCSEMVMPIGRGSNDTMFPAAPFDLKNFSESCKNAYGVLPRPHWITTYYGGADIKLILKKFGSNIIFSNGLRDPYSTGGVLENLSESLLAVYTKHGSHCLDILGASKDDPAWLVAQRKIEVEIIEGWIKSYYANLALIS